MILDEVFELLNATGRVPNHAVFSTDYLGRSPRYYDYLRCSCAHPSLETLLRVIMRLTAIAGETSEDLGGTEEGRMAKRIMRHIYMRCQ